MMLVVPYVIQPTPLDARTLRLAEFLGVPYETLALAPTSDWITYLEKALPDRSFCLLINPQVMKQWFGPRRVPAELITFLLSRCGRILVHGLRVDTFDIGLAAALSQGRLRSVDAIDEEASSSYCFAKDSKHICESFAGLSFGPVNPRNDRIFSINEEDPAVQKLISISSRPFMAAVKLPRAEVLFVGSEDVIDIDSEVGNAPLPEYFSRFVPHAMALRYVAGDECWRPYEAHASIIIDDPLLRTNYGFLNFDSLLDLANRHNFHTVVAFIPHNFRRNSSRITRMFQSNATRLSICFHGNDHTDREFASTDMDHLDRLLRVAEDRMTLHSRTAGLPCDRVMVFPQGNFSIEAMKALKFHNFHAAVNTVPHPLQQPVPLTIRELAQPAVLRFGGFPLFIRKPIREIQNYDIAFNLFFGRPVLIVEHHDLFKRPEALVEIVTRIKSVAPEIHWSNLATVVSKSLLMRKASSRTYDVRAYSNTVAISNDSNAVKGYSIEWRECCDSAAKPEHILVDEAPAGNCEVDEAGRIRIAVEIDPGNSHRVSLVHRNLYVSVKELGLRWKTRAFLRRRLSELRDNHLSKNQHVLSAAKTLQRRLLNEK